MLPPLVCGGVPGESPDLMAKSLPLPLQTAGASRAVAVIAHGLGRERSCFTCLTKKRVGPSLRFESATAVEFMRASLIA